jgi:ComEC/Rec2-related protein
MRRQGIWIQALVRDAMDAEILEHGRSWRIGMMGPALSQAIAAELRRGIEDRPQTHALISSMVLGIHGDGLLEAKPAFRDTGTLHLFAVSGLNLTMLAGLLGLVLRGLRVGPAVAPWGVLPVLGAYAVATGLGPSCIRALVMSVIVVLVPWVNRPAVALNSIGAAAVFLLLWNSNTLFEAGFQLSFVLVLALTLVAPRIGAFFERWAYPDALLPRRLWSSFQERRVRYWRPFAAGIAASLTVWIASVPWSLTLFHQITPVALIANLVAVPLAYVNLALGFVSLMLAPLGAVSPWLNRLNASVAEGLYCFVDFASRVPGGHIPLASPWERRPEVLCFNFPGGGGVLLSSGDKACLVDCGSETQARAVVLPALRSFGMGRIDALLLSHGSAPYIGGAITIYEALRPDLVLEGVLKDRSRSRREFRQWLGARGKFPDVVRAGDRFGFGTEASLEILFPPDSSGGSLAQDKGLVLRWRAPGYSLLYTAAAGFPTELWLLEHCPEKLRADVWIRGWHPREMTGTDDFVRSISPRVIVLMAPRIANDPDGVERWVERRRKEGISVFSQKRCGAVLGYGRGDGIEFRSYLGRESALW